MYICTYPACKLHLLSALVFSIIFFLSVCLLSVRLSSFYLSVCQSVSYFRNYLVKGRFSENEYVTYIVCFDLSYNFYLKMFHFWNNLTVDYIILNVLGCSCKMPDIFVSRGSVHWEPSHSLRTDRQTW
jgi:hypothetical protein